MSILRLKKISTSVNTVNSLNHLKIEKHFFNFIFLQVVE